MAASGTITIFDPKVLLDVGTLTTTQSDISYTAPAGEAGAQINSIYAVNFTGTGVVKFRARLIPSGGGTIQVADVSLVPDYVPYRMDVIDYLDAGDEIEMWSDSGTAVKVWITGAELKE